MSLWTRLRARLNGPKSVAGFRPEAGPFDAPPVEPVELDPADIPWELRDDQPRDD